MVVLYCGTWSNQNAPIQLFVELAGVEETEDPTPLGEEDGAQEPCMVVPVSYVVDSESDPDVDEIPDDIDDEGVNEEVNVNASSIGNQIRRIVIHNNPKAHMSRIDPDTAYAVEFPEYPKIQSAHRMVIYSDPEELFVGQRFESKEEVLKVGEMLQLADTSCIYPEVADVGDTKICWASHMHSITYDRRSPKT
ncbi:hypothetical protein GOBAR_AA01652 [Gossypium barbadense]|uniref:Uncharacterized protein n=1 Tax=Gossypium barbadense TaxID=3634 RepID=A0A2P5YTP6_GOSBA|nr:hypothetical protein GOBAR_AA01652 [Gossypium barbadense]